MSPDASDKINTHQNVPDKKNFYSKPSLIVQVYEIQTPDEAALMIELGVDHIGSVIVSTDFWKDSGIRETIRMREKTDVKSSLIPLFSDPDMIFRTLDFHQPDIIHFCEILYDHAFNQEPLKNLIEIHQGVRRRFPEIKMMRSIPIAVEAMSSRVPTLELAKMFEPHSDYFLTDTILLKNPDDAAGQQPESGFVGITGKLCDWKMAVKMVNQSQIPVILAGGISPENTYDGILTVKPAGVDSCTHTNMTDIKGRPIRFKKDPEKVKKFIAETRLAEDELSGREKP